MTTDTLTQTGYAALYVIFLMTYVIVGIAIAPSTPRHRRGEAQRQKDRP